MSNSKKALKSGLWYTASNFLVRSIGFITTPIFTRLLTHDEFGAFNNFTSWLNIITIVVTLNLQSTLISARYDYEEKFDEYILSMLSLSTVSVAIWFVIINCFRNNFVQLFDMGLPYINAMLLYLVFLSAVNFFQVRERYYFEYKMTVITSVLLSAGTALLSVGLVTLMPNRLTGRIIGSIVPTVLIGTVFFVYFIKKGKRVNFSYWKYALPICIPYIPHLLSMTLLNSTDRVMITKFCGTEQTALYSLAYNCGVIITLLMTSFNSAFAPWLGEKLNNNSINEIRRVSKMYIGGFFALALGIMLVSPELLLILGGKSYIEAIYVLAPVSMGCVCQFLYTLFVNVEQFKKKTVGMAIASMIAALSNFALNYIFIPKYGYLAAAYTTLAGYLLLLFIHMLLVSMLGLSQVYSYRFVLVIVALGIICMVGIVFLYSNIILRYVTLLCYIVILLAMMLINQEKIKTLISKKRGKTE